MYWVQDIESARGLARLWSELQHPPSGHGAEQGGPGKLPLPVTARLLIDRPAIVDVTAERTETPR